MRDIVYLPTLPNSEFRNPLAQAGVLDILLGVLLRLRAWIGPPHHFTLALVSRLSLSLDSSL